MLNVCVTEVSPTRATFTMRLASDGETGAPCYVGAVERRRLTKPEIRAGIPAISPWRRLCDAGDDAVLSRALGFIQSLIRRFHQV
jgi:hypothetical protein